MGIIAILLSISSIIVILLYLVGVFHKIKVLRGPLQSISYLKAPDHDTVWFLGKPYQGSYQKSYPEFTKVFEEMQQCNIPIRFRANVYLDDPDKTAPEHCRALMGVILHSRPEEFEVPTGYAWLAFDPVETNGLSAEFPLFKWAVNLSMLVAILRVYPCLKQAMKKYNCVDPAGFMDIYDFPNYCMQFLVLEGNHIEKKCLDAFELRK